MQEIVTLHFTDQESGDDGIAVVRAARGQVALALSLKKDGDVEVFLQRADCERIIVAMQQALGVAED